ncbi:MauE/DoxX family redox-associated membrane protein [Peterkaempfera griseoplana]|uniref:MauE/DoxX family redox-associated membrane protein n=1 Tax=Peterkaempfera griseoplana TaxID=66896 RepID=UPI0006E15218|nr:MauE/DoxX family redox-associated membrane protein [Peterkaempfera griseoplana]
MLTLLSASAVPVLGALLAVGGAAKLFGRDTARQAAGTALVRIVGAGRAGLALRAVGAAELLVGAGLTASPASAAPGMAAAALGAGFLGYLGWARVAAPESSCGCSARERGPVTWRSFARAALVLAGGAGAAARGGTWWDEVAAHPAAAAATAAATALALAALSTDLDHLWLLPLRRARLRLLGHPLAPTGTGRTAGRVPVAASVELLERSLAWQSMSSVVRSALLEHWDEGGWRILRFAGLHQDAEGTRPVSVLFALDAAASADTAPLPSVRVTVLDDCTDEQLPVTPPDVPVRTALTVLPLAT